MNDGDRLMAGAAMLFFGFALLCLVSELRRIRHEIWRLANATWFIERSGGLNRRAPTKHSREMGDGP
jgi:hypothetical protein